MIADPFWNVVRRKRNYLYAWAPACVVLSWLAVIGYHAIFGQLPSNAFGFAVLCVYVAVGWILQRKLLALLCPRCHKRALAHGIFFLRHAKCQYCGYAYNSPNQ